MSAFTVHHSGIFDTSSIFPGERESRVRTVTTFEAEFFLSCNGCVYIGDTEYRLIPNTLLLAKPGQTRHSVFGFRCVYLHFSLPQGSRTYERMMRLPDYFSILEAADCRAVLESLLRRLPRAEGQYASELIDAKMTELLCYLEEAAPQNRGERMRDGRAEALVPSLIAYLRENYAEPITLATLASRFHYSPNYIQSRFREATGKTPQAYLTEVRLTQAASLLAESELPISEVAAACGFCSQSHFTAALRRAIGRTPAALRRARQEEKRSLYGAKG